MRTLWSSRVTYSLFGVLALLQMSAGAAWAGDKIDDPRLWSDSYVKMLAANKVDGLIDEYIASSGNPILKHEDLVPTFAPIAPFLQTAGAFARTDLLAEKHYGQTVVVYWYYLNFEKHDLFVRLRLIKRGPYWKTNALNFNTDLDKIGLP